jgi:hypothetical protein
MMRKMRMAALAALGIALASTGANAATQITFDIIPGAPSANFTSGAGLLNQVSCDAGPVNCSGAFTASGSFNLPVGYNLVGATLTSGPASGVENNIDFLTASLNGFNFTMILTGVNEYRILDFIPLEATNTLAITGNTGGRGTFSGTLNFAAVPEPGTWALMLLGFGAIGYSLRRRKPGQVRVPQLA